MTAICKRSTVKARFLYFSPVQNYIVFHCASPELDQPLSYKMTLKHIQLQKCRLVDGGAECSARDHPSLRSAKFGSTKIKSCR